MFNLNISRLIFKALVSAALIGPLFAGANPDGSYSETIPIEIPAGRGGVQPQLALSYNSNSGNGQLGLGWSLQGLSAIARANDGNGVNYNNSDAFVSPQGKLYDVTGIGSVYRALNDNFTRYEPAGGSCGNGPCSWLATDAYGNKSWYGISNDSQVGGLGAIRIWALTKVEDANGNSYTIRYWQRENQLYLRDIVYNQTSSSYHRIDFEYDDRPDVITNSHAHAAVTTVRRLMNVRVFANCGWLACFFGEERNQYELQYSNDGGLSRLGQVNASVQGNLINFWRFEYSNLTGAPSVSFGTDGSGAFDPNGINQFTVQGDFNGDGKPDIAWRPNFWGYWVINLGGGGHIQLTDAHGAGFAKDGTQVVYVGDFDGDGRSDIAWRRKAWSQWVINPGNGANAYWLNSRSGFDPIHNNDQVEYVGDFDGDGRTDIAWRRRAWQYWEVDSASGSRQLWDSDYGFAPGDVQVEITGDFDGDGATDIAWRRDLWAGWNINQGRPGSSLRTIYDNSGSFVSDKGQQNTIETGDFDGDGRTDIAWRRNNWGHWQINYGEGHSGSLSDGNSKFQRSYVFMSPLPQYGRQLIPLLASVVGDFNGDGQSDIAWRMTTMGHWQINYGTGLNGALSDTGLFIVSTDTLKRQGLHPYREIKQWQRVIPGDFDGDGKTDIAWREDGWAHWQINYGSGQTAGALSDGVAGYFRPSAQQMEIAGDFNGDGATDISWRPAGWGHYTSVAGATNITGRIITRITNSSGGTTTIQYATAERTPNAVQIGNPNCQAGTGGSYNTVCGIPDTRLRALVTRVTSANQGLTLNDTGYAYENGRLFIGAPRDRKPTGFSRIVATNLVTGDFVVSNLSQAPLIAGAVYLQENRRVNNELLSRQTRGLPRVLDWGGADVSGYTHYDHLMQVLTPDLTERESLESGVLRSQNKQKIYSFDAFGQPLISEKKLMFENTEGFSRIEVSFLRYTAPSVMFPKGLPYSQKICRAITECAPGDANFVSETRSYYGAEPLGVATLTAKVSKKESHQSTGTNTGVWLQETYQYDAYGNVIETVDAKGIRTTITYDSNYQQFPVFVRKNHGSRNIDTAYDYDFTFGKVKEITDFETNNKTYITIDVTGFVTQEETRQGATVLARTTHAHSAFGVQPAWTQSCKMTGVNFDQATCVKKIADAFGRPYREEYPELIQGAQVTMAIERRYDIYGRESQVSEPFKANETPTKWTTKLFNAYSRLVKVTDSRGRIAETEYSPLSRMGVPSDAVGCVSVGGFDGKQKRTCNNLAGQPVRTYDAAHDDDAYVLVTYQYDTRDRLTNVGAQVGATEIGYVGSSGLQAYIRDPVAGRTEYTYHFNEGAPFFGKIKTEVRRSNTNLSDGYITTFDYAATFGRMSRVTKAAIPTPHIILETTTYTYDQTDVSFGKGKLTALTHLKGGFTIHERYAYDARGDLTQTVRRISHATETLCADADAMPCLQVFGKTKDEHGRVKTMLYPDGKQSTIEYVSDLGAYVSAIKHDGVAYATYGDYTYGVGTHLGKVTLGNGIEQTYTYEAATGLLQSTKIGQPSAAPLIDIGYQYDPSYNIARIEDSVVTGLSANFAYDSHNRIKNATLDSGASRTYKFDMDGQGNSRGKLELKDKRRMTYASNKTFPASDEVLNADTGLWQPNQSFTWSGTGNLLTKGPFTFTYDANSMMATATERQSTTNSAVVAESKFHYDHTGQRFLKTYTRAGITIKTWYLGDGIEVREKFVGVSPSSTTGTFDATQLTKYIYGLDDKKIASITGNVRGSRLAATSTGLFALADGFSSSTASGIALKTFYTFYGIYGYAAEVYREVTPQQARAILLVLCVLGLFALILTPSPSPHRGEGSEVSLSRRLTAMVTLFAFVTVHCGTGNVPGSTPIDLGDPAPNPTTLGTPGTATTAATPTPAFMSALYTGLPAGTVYYSHNHLGSGALVTDASGNDVFRITYTEYGEIDLANSGKYNPATGEIEHHLDDALIAITAVKYTGQEYDPETGFYYYNARYYDPQLGVFTTADTVYDKGSAFGFNRHMYVGGNPIMYSDPSGHSIWDSIKAIGAAIFNPVAAINGGLAAMGAANVINHAQTGQWLNKDQNWAAFGNGAATGAVMAASAGAGGWAGAAAAPYLGFLGKIGGAITSGAIGGGVGGAAMGGGSALVANQHIGEGMWKGFLSGALSGAIGGAFGHWAKGIKADSFWHGAARIGVEGTGAFTRGFAGGYTYAKLNGMSNRDALNFGLRGGGISLGAYGLGKISPFRMALRPNEKRDSMCQTRACLFSDGDPSVGPRTNVPGTGDDHWFTKGVARFFPGGDSMSNMHDDMLDYLAEGSPLEGQLGTQMPDALNYGTMVPALGFTAYDLALTMTENYGYMWR